MKETSNLKISGFEHPIRIRDPKEIIPLVLQSIGNLSLWSYDSLKYLYIGLLEMVSDYCDQEKSLTNGKEKAKYTRMKNRSNRALQFTPKNRITLLVKLYDMVLSAEGMGRLHGYGFTNRFGDQMSGNPEVHRTTIEQKEDYQ